MLTEERFAEILNILKEKGAVSVQELTEALGASESTIRRDLTEMNKKELLHKVHGGATRIETSFVTQNVYTGVRETINTEEKLKIAEYAASLISENDFVYIDSGTTAAAMAGFCKTKACKFVTNSVIIAQKLAGAGRDVILLGGRLDFVTQATVDINALLAMENYNFTKGFFGVNGIHSRAAYSTPDMDDAKLKSEAMKRCEKCYILADHTKFDSISNITFGKLSSAAIITSELQDDFWKGLTTVIEVDKLK